MHFADSLLNTVDHVSSKFGPVTSLVESLVERIVPQQEAKASSGIMFCGSDCYNYCDHYGTQYLFNYYSYTIDSCAAGTTWMTNNGCSC